MIAAHGRDGFYKGPLAKQILEYSASLGGTMVQADLENFEPEWVQPVSTTYRGWTVSELPPTSIGVAALSMLNIMERFPLAEYGHNSARALHVMIEAKKLAYADLAKYVGDPAAASADSNRRAHFQNAGRTARQAKSTRTRHTARCCLADLTRPAERDWQRYHLSLGCRQGRKHSLLHPERLR